MRNGLRSASVEALDHGAERDLTIFSIATSDLTSEDRLRRKGVVAATRNGRSASHFTSTIRLHKSTLSYLFYSMKQMHGW